MNVRQKEYSGKEGRKPLVGDQVEIEILDQKDMEGNLVEILPRKNELFRPAVANIDQALVLFALESPKPNAALLDRFLIMMEKENIPVFICFNKEDLAGTEEAGKWASSLRELRLSGHPCQRG